MGVTCLVVRSLLLLLLLPLVASVLSVSGQPNGRNLPVSVSQKDTKQHSRTTVRH